jgi:hypothetical protein
VKKSDQNFWEGIGLSWLTILYSKIISGYPSDDAVRIIILQVLLSPAENFRRRI